MLGDENGNVLARGRGPGRPTWSAKRGTRDAERKCSKRCSPMRSRVRACRPQRAFVRSSRRSAATTRANRRRRRCASKRRRSASCTIRSRRTRARSMADPASWSWPEPAAWRTGSRPTVRSCASAAGAISSATKAARFGWAAARCAMRCAPKMRASSTLAARAPSWTRCACRRCAPFSTPSRTAS